MTKTKKGMTALTIGALGVVFGDIGTSPLYALQALFGATHGRLALNPANVYGVISLILWSVTLVVSIKYVGFIMRADNKGEGGILALASLIKSSKMQSGRKWLFVLVGIIGVSLFYGDSSITPAISVLSATEGLKVVAPRLDVVIVPVTVLILTALFWMQKYGTGLIGRLFGPVMFVWFATIAAGGAWRVWQHPGILHALSPFTALEFFGAHPVIAFVSMTAVVLAVTGAEALYADLGHFGRKPISRAWFFVVFPALALCYMGEGALMLQSADMHNNLLVQLFPESARVAVIVLAMFATLIASQSVISGAFSLTRQAMQLNFLPKMLVRHTSIRETGQIYVPFVNAALFTLVTALVLWFGSSERLANAYGVAVSGTLLADTLLFLVVFRVLWHRAKWQVALLACLFVPLDLLFVTSNLSKIVHGGFFPLLVGAIMFFLIDTWIRAERIVAARRREMEGSLQDFIADINHGVIRVRRLPGQAVFMGHHPYYTPLALRVTAEQMHELPRKVAIVTVETSTQAHIPPEERATFDDLAYNDGISHVVLHYGFHDIIDVPKTLKGLRRLNPELDFDPYKAEYYISLTKVVSSNKHNLARWRKALYRLMARNRLGTSDYYKLPIEQTEEMQSLIKL